MSVSGVVCCCLFFLGLYCLRFPLCLMFVHVPFVFLCDYALVRCCLGYLYCLRLGLLFIVVLVCLLFVCVCYIFVCPLLLLCVVCLFVFVGWFLRACCCVV